MADGNRLLPAESHSLAAHRLLTPRQCQALQDVLFIDSDADPTGETGYRELKDLLVDLDKSITDGDVKGILDSVADHTEALAASRRRARSPFSPPQPPAAGGFSPPHSPRGMAPSGSPSVRSVAGSHCMGTVTPHYSVSAARTAEGSVAVSEAGARVVSQRSSTRVHVEFLNQILDSPVTVVWVDFEGNEMTWGTIKPDEALELDTFVGHVWRCYDSTQIYSDQHVFECRFATCIPQVVHVGGVCSLRSETPVCVLFESRHLGPLQVYWMDFDGRPHKFCRLDPGRRYLQQSYATHAWVFEDLQTHAVLYRTSLGTAPKQHLWVGEAEPPAGDADELDQSLKLPWAPRLKYDAIISDPEITETVRGCGQCGALFLDDPVALPDPGVRWRRPAEVFREPVWRRGGGAGLRARRRGPRGFLTALRVVDAQAPGALEAGVVCKYPSLGIYVFRFYKEGAPVKVMVDDLLPVTEGNAPYSACAAAGELWALLWEKAYAKLHGGYPALDSIAAPSALMDLTGVRPFEVHFKGRGRDAVTAEPFGGFGLEVDLGTEDGFMASLCRGHRWTACRDDGSGACEVVDCAWVEDGGRRRLLAKLRSCCGSEADRPTAEQVKERRKCQSLIKSLSGHILSGNAGDPEDDFWMSFDFCRRHMPHWYLQPSMGADAVRFRLISQWSALDPRPRVAPGLTAWQQQPQFVLQVSADSSGQIQLLQDDPGGPPEDVPWLSIGFGVYPSEGVAIEAPAQTLYETGRLRARDVSVFCTLKAGYYIVVPWVAESDRQGKFVLNSVADAMWSFRGPVFWGQDSQWCLCD